MINKKYRKHLLESFRHNHILIKTNSLRRNSLNNVVAHLRNAVGLERNDSEHKPTIESLSEVEDSSNVMQKKQDPKVLRRDELFQRRHLVECNQRQHSRQIQKGMLPIYQMWH